MMCGGIMSMKHNYTSFIFAIAFIIILINRWDSADEIDRVFYIIASIGFIILGVSSIVTSKKIKQ